MAPPKDWMSRREAAAYLNSLGCPLSASTLEKYASNNNAGKGPPFVRYRWKMVRYKRIELDAWAAKEGTRVE